MGIKYLKSQYKSEWTPKRPTTGYCYVVSEVIYHYDSPEGSRPYKMKVGADEHWFIKTPRGKIIDRTADQYNKPLDYSKGKPRNFKNKLSPRGKELAKQLKLTKKLR